MATTGRGGGIGGPHMPSLIGGIILGIMFTLAFQYLTAKPAESAEQRAISTMPAAGDTAK